MKTHASRTTHHALVAPKSDGGGPRITLRPAVLLFLLLSTATYGFAATLTPVSVTGFNRDVMVENTASSPPYYNLATNFNAGEPRGYYQTNLASTTRGLPLSGFFINATDGSAWQLQPYTASNALVLSSDTGLTNGTLFLTAPKIYDSIAVIANSGNGSAIGSAVL